MEEQIIYFIEDIAYDIKEEVKEEYVILDKPKHYEI